jgi:hypothetical protein
MDELKTPPVEPQEPATEPQPQQPTPPTPPPVSPYLWATYDQRVHSVRVLCDEAGLTWAEKAEICATIEAESEFNTTVEQKNYDKRGIHWSSDWGICQINDWYNIGPGKPFKTVDEVLQFPERSVRFMIDCCKQGHIDWWIAHKLGRYEKYLPKYLNYKPQNV